MPLSYEVNHLNHLNLFAPRQISWFTWLFQILQDESLQSIKSLTFLNDSSIGPTVLISHVYEKNYGIAYIVKDTWDTTSKIFRCFPAFCLEHSDESGGGCSQHSSDREVEVCGTGTSVRKMKRTVFLVIWGGVGERKWIPDCGTYDSLILLFLKFSQADIVEVTHLILILIAMETA